MGPNYDTELHVGKQYRNMHAQPRSCNMVQKGVGVIYIKFVTDNVTFNSFLKEFKIPNVRENLSKRDHQTMQSVILKKRHEYETWT